MKNKFEFLCWYVSLDVSLIGISSKTTYGLIPRWGKSITNEKNDLIVTFKYWWTVVECTVRFDAPQHAKYYAKRI